MSETTKYASAVAAVKAMENTLLNRSDMEQLINAASKAETEALLSSKKGTFETNAETVWNMIRDYAPDCRETEILLYKNDFHNLKAALKASVSGRTAEEYYIRPTNLDLDKLSEDFGSKNYGALPEHIRATASEAYDILVKTSDGQLTDSFIDAAALAAMQKSAKSFGGEFMRKYAELTTVCADIKTAFRCSKMNKRKNFFEMSVCGSESLDKDSLIKAALGGIESLLGFLETAGFGEAAKLLGISGAQFEKWCDDIIMELAETARMRSFGPEPLEAYFIAAEAEQKNLRIISVCKEFGADRETITERMRKLYV